ncbi:hypothetical protein D3C85_1077110 [compost metagenome]
MFDFVAVGQGDARDEDADAGVRQQHAVPGAWLAPKAAQPLAVGAVGQSLPCMCAGGGHRPGGQPQPQHDQRRAQARRPRHGQRQQHGGQHADDEGGAQLARQVGHFGLLPARHRPHAHQEDRGRHQRYEHRFKVWRADGDLAPVQHVENHGVQGAQQH